MTGPPAAGGEPVRPQPVAALGAERAGMRLETILAAILCDTTAGVDAELDERSGVDRIQLARRRLVEALRHGGPDRSGTMVAELHKGGTGTTTRFTAV